jgi:cytochrome P450
MTRVNMNLSERSAMLTWFTDQVWNKISEQRMLDKPCFTGQSFDELMQLLLRECEELIDAAPNDESRINEAVDVAAFAMFIAYNTLTRNIEVEGAVKTLQALKAKADAKPE